MAGMVMSRTSQRLTQGAVVFRFERIVDVHINRRP